MIKWQKDLMKAVVNLLVFDFVVIGVIVELELLIVRRDGKPR